MQHISIKSIEKHQTNADRPTNSLTTVTHNLKCALHLFFRGCCMRHYAVRSALSVIFAVEESHFCVINDYPIISFSPLIAALLLQARIIIIIIHVYLLTVIYKKRKKWL